MLVQHMKKLTAIQEDPVNIMSKWSVRVNKLFALKHPIQTLFALTMKLFYGAEF